MCKFCEKYVHTNEYGTDEQMVDPLYENEEGDMACIVEPSPISKRKHEKDGLTAELQVSLAPDYNLSRHAEFLYIPIRYCPICGRDLTKK